MAERRDAVLIGSGHNSLVAAAYLARAGMAVEVLERNAVAGGAIATEELIRPGFHHDTFSAWHPLFKLSDAFAELGEELAARGLDYVETEEEVTASVRSDGRTLVAYRDPERTAGELDPRDRGAYLAELESFGQKMPAVAKLLGSELHSPAAARMAGRLTWQLGRRGALAFTSDVLRSGRGWCDACFQGSEVAELLLPWALHTGLSPDAAGSGFQVLAIAGALHAVGLPIVRGGSINFVRALERLIADGGGTVSTGAEVERILVSATGATGVLAAGRELLASRAVIAGTTPTQLYGRLLAPGAAPEDAVRQAARYRYNPRAGMQIHLALSEPLRWRDRRLDRVPLVHLHDGAPSIALACAEAAAGLLPRQPTIAVGQHAMLDPSRAPAGAATLWIQLQQVPYAPRGDAAGEIDTGEGSWTDALRDAYVQRVLQRIAPHVENLSGALLGSAALTPAELERRNPNLVRGDIYSGDCEISQFHLWRPLPGYGSHATPVARLYACGAATYPGPGLNAASGRIVARALTAPGLRARLPRIRRG